MGAITILHQKFLVSEYRKTSLGNVFEFRRNSGRKKNVNKRGGYDDFRLKVLSHSTEKIRGETCVSEMFWFRKVFG